MDNYYIIILYNERFSMVVTLYNERFFFLFYFLCNARPFSPLLIIPLVIRLLHIILSQRKSNNDY